MKTERYLAICVVWLVWAGLAAGDIHYVAEGQSIQAAIDAADSGDEIEVAPGTYEGPGDETEDSALVDFKGKAVRLYGAAGLVVIDGSRYQHVVRCISGEGPGTILEGLIITGGGWGEYPSGGGMYNRNSSPTVTNCRFMENHAYYDGGAMYNVYASPVIKDCTFVSNISYMSGVGISNDHSSPMVINCIFAENGSSYYGGAMTNWSSSPTVINCIFNGNSAVYEGGAMANYGGSPIVTHCIFINNVIHVSGEGGGSAMYNAGSNATVTNCIVWGNSEGPITGDSGTVTYSDVQGGWTGVGNIDIDPLFMDYRLQAGSPCIDAGTNSPAGGLPATDIEGNPRPVDGDGDGRAVADMGVYEAPATTPGQPLADLIQQVRALNLERGLSTALEAKLNTAQRILADGNAKNDAAAVNARNAFINSVKAQRGKKIAQADADGLIAAARQIIGSLGNP